MTTDTSAFAWAVLWRSENALDGREEVLCGTTEHPSRTLLFHTRQEARAYVLRKYAYIRERPDLKMEPHGWKMPVPVRVKITIQVAA